MSDLDKLPKYVVLDREEGEGIIEEVDDGAYHHEDCTRWFATADVAPLFEELKARRAAMRKMEWVQHGANEYEQELQVCPHCGGIRGRDYERIDSWQRHRYHEGHKPDCVYTRYPSEGSSDE